MKASCNSTGHQTIDHPPTDVGGSVAHHNSGAPDTARSMLRHRTYTWGEDYAGTKAGLIAAGLARDGQFPGDPGRIGGTQHFDHGGNSTSARLAVLTIRRYGKKFELRVSASKEEQKARGLASDEEEQKARRLASDAASEWKSKAAVAAVEVQRATDDLADLAGSKKEFSKRAADNFWTGYNVFHAAYANAKPGDSGYYFTPADRERFVAQARRLFASIHHAKPKLDAAKRMSKLNAARAKAAKVDLPLQRMLTSASAAKLVAMDDGDSDSSERTGSRADGDPGASV